MGKREIRHVSNSKPERERKLGLKDKERERNTRKTHTEDKIQEDN